MAARAPPGIVPFRYRSPIVRLSSSADTDHPPRIVQRLRYALLFAILWLRTLMELLVQRCRLRRIRPYRSATRSRLLEYTSPVGI